MNRMVKASATNPSAAWLSGRTPSSCGWRRPRLYNCVARVEVLTWRSLSSAPSGNGSSWGRSVTSPLSMGNGGGRAGAGAGDGATREHLGAGPGVPVLLARVPGAAGGQDRPAGHGRLPPLLDRGDEVRRDQLGVLLLGGDG